MNITISWVSKFKIAKAVILLVAILFILTPLAPAFADEVVPPAAEPVVTEPEDVPSEIVPDPSTPEITETPTDSVTETPATEVEQAPADPAATPAEDTEAGKPVEEPPAQNQTLLALGADTPPLEFAIPKQPKANVDQSTGGLTYFYPIELPEGRTGMTPKLALTYNSRNSFKPDSITGLGWELSVPYIQREPVKGTQNLYTKGYFSSSVSGNLISTTDNSSSQYTVYRPESDDGSYLKYTFNNDNSWTVTGKDGLTYTYGAAASSRQDDPSDATKIYKWMLTKIADTHGNEIQYSYTKDNGQIYPSQILYTYNASSPAVNTVAFTYTTPASYGATTYNTAFPVKTLKLLSTITVTTTISAQTATHTYTLAFNDAQFQKQKLLSTVTHTVSFPVTEFNQSFNDVTTFSYSTKTPGWETGTHSLATPFSNVNSDWTPDIYTADFDANGYPDILVSHYFNNIYTNKLILNDGTSFTDQTSAWSLPTNVLLGAEYAIVDLNGDHLPDFHPRFWSTQQPPPVYLNTGSGFTADSSGTWLMKNYVSQVSSCAPNDPKEPNINSFLFDINNDGKNDIVYFGGDTNFKVALNNGAGWTISNNYTFTINPGSNYDWGTCGANYRYQTLIDVNGDGLLDYFHEQFGTYLNTGSGFAYSAGYSNISIPAMDRSGLADINGDGLVDVVAQQTDSTGHWCTPVYLNTGTGFSLINPSGFPTNCTYNTNWSASQMDYIGSDPTNYRTLLDVTADGYPDIIGPNPSVGHKSRVYAINDAQSSWVTNPTSGDPWTNLMRPYVGMYLDYNSDGIIDFISPNTNWGPTKAYQGKTAIPNQLTQIQTPLGAQTAIEYGTAPTNLSDRYTAPMPVVKKVTVQNVGHGQPSDVTQYSYSGGAYVTDSATGQKRFAGFNKVTATESGTDLVALRVTDTYFHQANGSDSASNEPTDTSLALIGKPYYTVTKHPSGTPKKETWNKYGNFTLVTEPVIGRLSKFVYPTETVNKMTESGATTGTAEVYTFDTTLGEQTQTQSLGFVTVASDGSYTDIPGDTRYEFTEYATNGGSTIVKPSRKDVRTTTSASDTVARTEYYYDLQALGTIGSLGDLTKESKWVSGNGSTVADTVYTYDSFGNVLTRTNPRTALTTYVYDTTKSQVASETNHLNQTISYTYVDGKLKTVTDPNGRVTTYGYSTRGWLYSVTTQNTGGSKKVTNALASTSGGIWYVKTTSQLVSALDDTSYQSLDNFGRPVRKVRELRNHITSVKGALYLQEAKTYDVLGRESTTSASTGISDSSAFSTALPNLLAASVPSNLITTTSYDTFDRPTSVANSIGTTSYAYAGPETTATDGNNHQKKTKADGYGNLVQVKEYNGGSTYTTNYTYDNRNLLTNITDALGNVRNFTYNNAGWLTNSEDLHTSGDASFGSTSWTYDLNGNKLVETKPDGVTVTKVYDMLDRPTSIDGSSTAGTDYTLTYDSCTNGKGHVCTVTGTLPNSVTLSKSYVYGISGVPTSVSLTTQGNTYTTSYLYNYSDEVSKVTYPNGTVVRYTFGDWALPAVVYTTLPAGSETTYATVTYHHTLKPSTITVTSGPTITNTYDSAKLWRKSNYSAVMSGNTLQSYGYTYDNVNNITQIAEPNLTKTYTYDDLNRLTQAVHTPTGGGATTYNYAYDAIGNITSANGNSYTYSGTAKTNPHAVTSVGASSYTYDDNGNIATAPNQTFTFNWQNQPTRVALGGTTNIDSYYDESGQRFIYQTPSTTEIQAEDNYLLRGTVPEVSIKLGDMPIGTINNNTIYSSIADHLGTPVKQINSAGTAVETVTYDPYGKVLTQTGTLNTKEGFTGLAEDLDTGLVYANARYYSPAMSRFTSQDPVFVALGDNDVVKQKTGQNLIQVLADPQQLNSYSYARSNPLMLVDATGEFPSLAQIWTSYGQTVRQGVQSVGNIVNKGLDYNARFWNAERQWMQQNPKGAELFANIVAIGGGVAFNGTIGKTLNIREGSPLRFSQNTASPYFSADEKVPALLRGASRASIVEGLKNGTINPRSISVDYVERNGLKVLDNNRSASVLQEAGIPENQWNLQNRTGVRDVEDRINMHLRGNKLPSTGTKTIILK